MIKAAGAFITHNNKILMLHRDNNPEIPNPDCWQFIGGQTEGDETYLETAKREIKEEINLEISELIPIGEIIDKDLLEYFLYYVQLSDDEVNKIKLGNEGQELKFFSVDEMDGLKMNVGVRNYYDKYRKGMKKLLEENILDKKALGFNEEEKCYLGFL
jgi:8-oxo-dGTP diphosphatase